MRQRKKFVLIRQHFFHKNKELQRGSIVPVRQKRIGHLSGVDWMCEIQWVTLFSENPHNWFHYRRPSFTRWQIQHTSNLPFTPQLHIIFRLRVEQFSNGSLFYGNPWRREKRKHQHIHEIEKGNRKKFWHDRKILY